MIADSIECTECNWLCQDRCFLMVVLLSLIECLEMCSLKTHQSCCMSGYICHNIHCRCETARCRSHESARCHLHETAWCRLHSHETARCRLHETRGVVHMKPRSVVGVKWYSVVCLKPVSFAWLLQCIEPYQWHSHACCVLLPHWSISKIKKMNYIHCTYPRSYNKALVLIAPTHEVITRHWYSLHLPTKL